MASILFVCTGNICRSPSAEGVFRHLLTARGLEARVQVDSAGTHGWHEGEAPNPRAVRAAARRGYDLRALRARPVRRGDFGAFDLILGMDEEHRDWLERRRPKDAGSEIALLLEYAEPRPADLAIPDPYYGDERDYEHALDLIEAGAKGLLAEITRRLR